MTAPAAPSAADDGENPEGDEDMAKARKVIITCATTGSIHTPTMSPHLPLTPESIAQQAIDAAKAGASILHLHARNADDGRPSADPDVFVAVKGFWGRRGATSVNLRKAAKTSARKALTVAWSNTAPKRLVRAALPDIQ